MGEFRRTGRFGDRSAFLSTLRGRLERLRTTVLPGMTEVWERETACDRVRIAGYGATIEFEVRERDWGCRADLPDWLPIPQRIIEEKFDAEFGDLENHS
jgi:hypothetical protein